MEPTAGTRIGRVAFKGGVGRAVAICGGGRVLVLGIGVLWLSVKALAAYVDWRLYGYQKELASS